MAVMRPEATPTRPSPAVVFVVNLLSTCLCTAVFAIYHVALGVRQPESDEFAMGRARQAGPEGPDFCAWFTHGKIGGRQRHVRRWPGSSYPRVGNP